MKSRRLTIYLLREDVADFEGALADDKNATAVDLASSSGLDGRFYYVSPHSSAPLWVSFVQPVLADQLASIRTSSASGLLLVRASSRLFALTFGYGRSLLDLAKIEYQFGLRVALNRIDPTQIRSLDTKTFEDMVVTTNTQVSQSAELPAFGVDVATDLLRAVTGAPRDANLGKRLSGADPLVMNVQTAADDLTALCSKLLVAFKEDGYKTDFGWIDHLEQVRAADVLTSLNDALLTDLTAADTSRTHLAMPEAISWEDIDAFKVGGSRRGVEYDDLDLDQYLQGLGDARVQLTLDVLKSRKVSVRFSRSENFDSRWSLYNCLVSEQRIGGALFVLIEGRWFSVQDSLVAEVDGYVSKLPAADAALIPAGPGETETAYNKRLVGSCPDDFLNLDAKIKRPGGAASGIEFCDVLTKRGELIHVKRKSRSSTLSHLFAQGTVSATTFLADGDYRDELRKLVTEQLAADVRDAWLDLIPPTGQEVERAWYRVTYAVVTNAKDGAGAKDWLPFFSKLNLMQHAKQLQNLGLKVSITRVPVAAAIPPGEPNVSSSDGGD